MLFGECSPIVNISVEFPLYSFFLLTVGRARWHVVRSRWYGVASHPTRDKVVGQRVI